VPNGNEKGVHQLEAGEAQAHQLEAGEAQARTFCSQLMNRTGKCHFSRQPLSVLNERGNLAFPHGFIHKKLVTYKDKTHRRQCKMSISTKNWPVKGLFATGVYLSEAQNPHTPPHTSIQYTYSHREGGTG
jgi:hypothetical protein